MGSHYCCSECGEYMCLGECLDEQKEEIVVKQSHNNTENMLDKIAIKIENEEEWRLVQGRLNDLCFDMNRIKGLTFEISGFYLLILGLHTKFNHSGEIPPIAKKVTCEYFLSNYLPIIDRQELIAQLQYYQMKRIENETYTSYNETLSRDWIGLDNKLTDKIAELESKLGWDL